MPVEAPELVNLVSPSGEATTVPVDQAGTLLTQGYSVESVDQATQRLAGAAREQFYGDVAGQTTALLAGGARGLTAGLSDLGLAAVGAGDQASELKAANPGLSMVGEIGGAVAGAFAAPGSVLARTPAGLTTQLGTKIAGLGEAANVGRIAKGAYTAGGAAAEGALQNAGGYISDVALGDRELSADGFLGAMGKGALWGGVAGGALATGSAGLQAARRLFPKSEMSKQAVQAAEDAARREVADAVADGELLREAAANRLRQIRADRAALDLDTKARLDRIAIEEAEVLSKHKASEAAAKAERAQVQLEKAKAPPVRRQRKAFEEGGAAPADPPPSAAGAAGEAIPPGGPTAAQGATDDAATLLERQLAATKQGLDAGASLADLSGSRRLKPTHVEDALNAEIAKVDPEAARLVKGLAELDAGNDAMTSWLGKYGAGGNVGKFQRGQASRDTVAGWRKKEGYVDVLPMDSQRPGFTEGGMGAPRGRQSVWRGSDEARELADRRTMSKLAPEEQLAADDAIEAMFGRKQPTGDEIIEGAAPGAVDEQIQNALASKVDSIDDDIAESAASITRHEAATADLADALGPLAPPTSQLRAQEFKRAQAGADDAVTEQAARGLADAERAADMISIGATPPKGRMSGAIGLAKDVGSAAEALNMMGIDVPDPSSLPVVGPVLGMYLKARLLGKAFGRFGGKVVQTAEGTIASKAASTRERVMGAVDKMMDVTSKGMAKAAPKIGGAASILGHRLFDDGEPQKRAYSSTPAEGSVFKLYQARADEVARAVQPGAIDAAVRKRIKASDARIMEEVVKGLERKFAYLDRTMPKPAEPPVPGQAHMPWIPSRAQINSWSRRVEAAEDPAQVLEDVVNGGHLSIEAVETIREVYPRLYQEAQFRAIEAAQNLTEPMPYHRRVQLSVLFEIPFDGSQTPEGAAFLQESYKPPPPPVQPQAPQTTPTVTTSVGMSDRTNPDTRI